MKHIILASLLSLFFVQQAESWWWRNSRTAVNVNAQMSHKTALVLIGACLVAGGYYFYNYFNHQSPRIPMQLQGSQQGMLLNVSSGSSDTAVAWFILQALGQLETRLNKQISELSKQISNLKEELKKKSKY